MRRIQQIVAGVAGLVLLTGSLTACSSIEAGDTVLAHSVISAADGGTIAASNGAELTIPPGVLVQDSEAQIVEVEDGVYDFHIEGEWHGEVSVTLPLTGDNNAIVHQVGDTWVLEGSDFGESTVSVTQLSWFSTLLSKAAGVICLKFLVSEVVSCLLQKGIKKINTEFALWIAQQLGDSCILNLVLTAVVNRVETVLMSLFGEPCIASAGEANPQELIAQDQAGGGGEPAPAPPAQEPAPPAPQPPAPPAPAPAPAPAPSGYVADGGFVGHAKNSLSPSDPNFYYWHYLSICVANLAPGAYTLRFSSDTATNYHTMTLSLPANGCVSTGQQGGTLTPGGVSSDWYVVEVVGQFVTGRYQPWT